MQWQLHPTEIIMNINYKLKSIVPWGRNLEEYKTMFSLNNKDLKKKILGCGDGPSSFNAELTELGGDVTSIDPIYEFTREQLSKRIDEVAVEVMSMVRQYSSNFVWKNIKNPDELESVRMSAMRAFLADYQEGLEQKRYRFEMLPNLSFENKSFDLALSSHFLFLYSEHLDFKFHLNSILEMLRVAEEVRIFPLMTLNNIISPHLDKVGDALAKKGYTSEIIKTEHEFQRGGDEMMKVYLKEN